MGRASAPADSVSCPMRDVVSFSSKAVARATRQEPAGRLSLLLCQGDLSLKQYLSSIVTSDGICRLAPAMTNSSPSPGKYDAVNVVREAAQHDGGVQLHHLVLWVVAGVARATDRVRLVHLQHTGIEGHTLR